VPKVHALTAQDIKSGKYTVTVLISCDGLIIADLLGIDKVAFDRRRSTKELDNEAPSVNANAATPAEAAAANPQLAHFIATSSVPKVSSPTCSA
jgi:hypothetical protein